MGKKHKRKKFKKFRLGKKPNLDSAEAQKFIKVILLD